MSSVRETAVQAVRAVHAEYGELAARLLGLRAHQMRAILDGTVPQEATAKSIVAAAAEVPAVAPEPWPGFGRELVARFGSPAEAAEACRVTRQALQHWLAGSLPKDRGLDRLVEIGVITETERVRARIERLRRAARGQA